jgi:ATP-dependent Lhr-like helicase
MAYPQRHEHEFLRISDSPMIEGAGEITWHNYAGGAANLLLQKVFESELGEKVIARNVSLTLRGSAGQSLAALHEVLARLRAEGRPNEADALRFAEGAKRGRLSKFEACLPDGMLQRFFARTVVDLAGARRAVGVADD